MIYASRIWEVFGALLYCFPLRTPLGYLSYCFVCVRKYLHVCSDWMKKHCVFTLLLPCIGDRREEVSQTEEGRALVRDSVTDLMALAGPFCYFGLQFSYL